MKEFKKIIDIKGEKFVLKITKSYEILFYRSNVVFDDAGFEVDTYTRVDGMKYAVPLFKAMEKEIAYFIAKEKPPYLFYTAAYDETRYGLYKRLAKRFVALGYKFIGDSERPNMFYLNRVI